MVDQLDVFFQNEDCACGSVGGAATVKMLWIAIRNRAGSWFVVFRGRVRVDDHSLATHFIDAIRNQLSLKMAA